MNKRETHIVTGMTKDLAISRFEPSYVYDARNIRIRTVGNNSTMLSVTNEKGTAEFTLENGSDPIVGTILGTASFSDTLVIFTKDETYERIYKLVFNEDYTSALSTRLYQGTGLNLQYDHPLETLALFENESIKKVYWVDGVNQPRVINIGKTYVDTEADKFNFNREIGADAKIEVTKFNSGGEFRPGTVQYCFNYFDKFGQETNIVDVSPLYYISPKDSGLAADDVSGCSFQVALTNLNVNFEYVRLYAIYRSSENATPNVRIVGDYKINTVLTATRDNQPSSVVVSEENCYWVSKDLSERESLSSYYTGPWNGMGPTKININGGYIYDASTEKYYNLYYLNTDPIQRVDGMVMQKGINDTYIIPDNGYPYFSRTGLMEVSYRTSVGITIIDTGTYGSTIDAEALLFIGGQYVVAETLAEKDNTLFLGNLKNEVPNIGDIEVSYDYEEVKIKELRDVNPTLHLITLQSQEFDYTGTPIDTTTPDSQIPIYQTSTSVEDTIPFIKDNNRSSQCVKGFKARENYRLGFIAQYKTGQWSEVIWLDDFTEEYASGEHHFFSDMENGQMLWGQQFRSAGFKGVISSYVVNALQQNSFIKVAPVVVYPSVGDRLVLCQGLLCPTLFNSRDRGENAPFAQADWRFRLGYNWNRVKDEIQLNATEDDYAPEVPFAFYKGGNDSTWSSLTNDKFDSYFPTEYYRDPNILTFHSPDLDSSEELKKDDFEDVSLRLVGFSNNGFKTYYDSQNTVYNTVERLSPNTKIFTYVSMDTLGFGDKSTPLIDNIGNEGTLSNNLLFKGFYDNAIQEVEDEDGHIELDYIGRSGPTYSPPYYTYYTYLWHRNGSLNSQSAVSNKFALQGGIRTAVYKRKVFSMKTLAYTTYFNKGCNFSADDIINVPLKDLGIFDTDQSFMISIDTANQEERRYYGNIDSVLVNGFAANSNVSFYDATSDSSHSKTARDYSDGYLVRYTDEPINDTRTIRRVPGSGWSHLSVNGKDPVSMKYKTTRHIVLSLNSSLAQQLSELGGEIEGSQYIYWLDEPLQLNGYYLPSDYYTQIAQDETLDYSFRNKCIYIGELYRDMTPERLAARFGGNTQEALTANIWTLAGDTVKLVEGQDAVLYYKEGDTYFGRYECLKSYPYTQEDKQSIVSIYSTEIESRVNLDFRYGNTMNLDDNTMVTPQNFNLYNHEGYEQTNQYFTYRTLDYDRYVFHEEGGRRVQDFPNMITWSLEKTLGEDVDKWTSISLTSTMDLDGTKGEITKLTRFNNEIFAFQESAFAQVLFNSRVQIPVSDGVPVEITNGYKVDGKRYISEHIGMQNKWSLGVTPYSMYFVDDNKNSIFSYNGQLADLSTIKGMKSWDYMNYTKRKSSWTPYLNSTSGYKNLRTFYDSIYNEVYFTTDTESLVYSETLGNFTSFLDYGKLPYLGNMGNKFLALTDEETRLYELWAGDYNKFFGEKKGYSLTFVANADPTMDKVFNNLEWRSTSYNGTTYLSHNTFDTLKVWHEHQDTGDVTLNDTVGLPTSLKKKFNAFRAFIPRDKTYKMNRIRNPWIYIKLSKEHPDKEKMMFTDLNVDFFE